MIKVSVSILNLDFANLERSLKNIETAGVDSFHMDIMDGHFVDNISFGPDLVKIISRITTLPLHSHLMISNPEKFVDRFFSVGSETVTIHVETLNDKNLHILDMDNIGISLNPDMPTESVFPYLHKVKRVLVMSVMPGFGGQQFMESSIESIRRIAEKRSEIGSAFIISVDGGVNYDTGLKCMAAGADELAVGSYITKSDDPAEKIRRLKTY